MAANATDSAHQPKYEAYACLVALTTWQHVLHNSNQDLVLFGDAQGVLQAIVARKARHPLINNICGEIQLVMAPVGRELEAVHWWSKEHHLADTLSRLKTAEAPKGELSRVPRTILKPRVWLLLDT